MIFVLLFRVHGWLDEECSVASAMVLVGQKVTWMVDGFYRIRIFYFWKEDLSFFFHDLNRYHFKRVRREERTDDERKRGGRGPCASDAGSAGL